MKTIILGGAAWIVLGFAGCATAPASRLPPPPRYTRDGTSPEQVNRDADACAMSLSRGLWRVSAAQLDTCMVGKGYTVHAVL
jgi:hypothetical protein